VLEPVSEHLRELLLELNLCSHGDLRRCRRLVRRLTFNLPAFDSVWLDALVQMQRLTPFQARMLASSRPRTLEIGPCVAIDRLGGGHRGQTFLARPRDGREKCVAKVLHSSPQLTEQAMDRLSALVERVGDLAHPSLVAPASFIRPGSGAVLVSRYVPGPHLGELLVRRGRFPAPVVWEIGRQLADGLATLADRGCSHGDIRAANVRLTSAGAAVLVDSGIRPALDPALTYHAGLTPEQCDGVAPELIGSTLPPSAASDAYALGCLLWQLLAGRPPFPGGDPLVKLAAHQTRIVDDVVKWAPDTPPALAEGIKRLTARHASDRPKNFLELLEFWGAPNRQGRRRLAGFRRRFDSPARETAKRRNVSTPTRWLFVAAALFALSGAAVTLADKGARNVALAWAAQISQSFGTDAAQRREIAMQRAERPEKDNLLASVSEGIESGRPLPNPDRRGVVHLDAQGIYRASDITAVGELSIVGPDRGLAQIVIGERPLKLWAEKVKLQRVQIAAAPGISARPPKLNALALIQAQELAVSDCVFAVDSEPGAAEIGASVGNSLSPIAPPTGPALIAWKLLDPAEGRGGRGTVRNSLFYGEGPAVYLSHAVRQLEFDDVLKVGVSPLVQLAAVPPAKSSVVVRLNHTTCRMSGAILRWIVPETPPRGSVLIDAADCVFDLGSQHAALIELAGRRPDSGWLRSMRMTGEGSIVGRDLTIAAFVSTIDGRLEALDASALELEGIFSGPFEFAGAAGLSAADSQIETSEAPRRSSDRPGIHAAALPDFCVRSSAQ